MNFNDLIFNNIRFIFKNREALIKLQFISLVIVANNTKTKNYENE